MSAVVTQTFAVSGMHCSSCSMLIDDVLEDVIGVVRSDTSRRKGLTRVEYDAAVCAPESIVEAIAEAGYQAVPAG